MINTRIIALGKERVYRSHGLQSKVVIEGKTSVKKLRTHGIRWYCSL